MPVSSITQISENVKYLCTFYFRFVKYGKVVVKGLRIADLRRHRTKIVRQMRRRFFRQMKQNAQGILWVSLNIFLKLRLPDSFIGIHITVKIRHRCFLLNIVNKFSYIFTDSCAGTNRKDYTKNKYHNANADQYPFLFISIWNLPSFLDCIYIRQCRTKRRAAAINRWRITLIANTQIFVRCCLKFCGTIVCPVSLHTSVHRLCRECSETISHLQSHPNSLQWKP